MSREKVREQDGFKWSVTKWCLTPCDRSGAVLGDGEKMGLGKRNVNNAIIIVNCKGSRDGIRGKVVVKSEVDVPLNLVTPCYPTLGHVAGHQMLHSHAGVSNFKDPSSLSCHFESCNIHKYKVRQAYQSRLFAQPVGSSTYNLPPLAVHYNLQPILKRSVPSSLRGINSHRHG